MTDSSSEAFAGCSGRSEFPPHPPWELRAMENLLIRHGSTLCESFAETSCG